MKGLNRLTVQEAADKSGYSVRYIRQLCREEKLDWIRVGQAYLIDPESLSDYVKGMKRLGPSKHDPTR